MVQIPTISQLNKIGERLRKNQASEDDIRQLDVFISSFTPAFEQVFSDLTQCGLNPGGRPHKTTTSIIAKLKREQPRLSKMQDISGCRVEATNRGEQDRIADMLQRKYPGAKLQDRRKRPSHGYRAVHLIVWVLEHQIEIQIRTALQHAWASATEKLADTFDDISIKYGGGSTHVRRDLDELSEIIADFEVVEADYSIFQSQVSPDNQERSRQLAEKLESHKSRLKKLCEGITIRWG